MAGDGIKDGKFSSSEVVGMTTQVGTIGNESFVGGALTELLHYTQAGILPSGYQHLNITQLARPARYGFARIEMPHAETFCATAAGQAGASKHG